MGLNCFSSPGHDDPSPSPRRGSLPPLQASPPRSPSRRASANANNRRSFDANGRGRSEMKMRIGAPTGFQHVAHVGGDGAFGKEGGQLASSLAAITSALGSAPLRSTHSVPSSPVFSSSPHLHPHSTALDMARSASAGPSSPSLSFRASGTGTKHASMPPPVSSSAPFRDASNRSPVPPPSSSHPPSPSPLQSPALSPALSPSSSPNLSYSPSSPPSPNPNSAASRRQSLQSPVKRKPPPAVTASVIRAVPGGVAEVERSGGVPTLARSAGGGGGERLGSGAVQEGTTGGGQGGEGVGGERTSVLDVFTPSEIRAIQHYQQDEPAVPAAAAVASSGGGGGGGEALEAGEKREGEDVGDEEMGPQTKLFNRSMAQVEAALNGP